MKVRDLKKKIERNRELLKDLQQLENKLSNNPDLCSQLNDELSTVDILRSIKEVRSMFYEHEIYYLEKVIDDAEVNIY